MPADTIDPRLLCPDCFEAAVEESHCSECGNPLGSLLWAGLGDRCVDTLCETEDD